MVENGWGERGVNKIPEGARGEGQGFENNITKGSPLLSFIALSLTSFLKIGLGCAVSQPLPHPPCVPIGQNVE
jgi:hypothetical protein